MTPHRSFPGVVLSLLAVPTLAGCNFEAERAPVSDQSLIELCNRPEQLLADVWHLAHIIGEPLDPETSPSTKVGSGGHCQFDLAGGRRAVLSLIRDTPGLGDPPRDADTVHVGEHVVKTWTIDPTTLTFETTIGGWQGSIAVTSGSGPEPREPAATDSQIQATAEELVKIVSEFKGPDFTPTQY